MLTLAVVSLESLYLIIIKQASWWLPVSSIVIAIVAWHLIGWLGRRGVGTKGFLTLAAIIGIMFVPELWLRMIDYHWGAHISFGGLRPKAIAYFKPDQDLFWKRSPDEPGINSLGFWGPDIITPKPGGVYRVVVLGDSCAEQDYARFLERCLNSSLDADATRYECALLAVAGYSSYQGKVIAEKVAPALEPDLAVICYGWNDHWLAYGATDEDYARGGKIKFLANLLGSSRLVQFCRMLLASLSGSDEKNIIDEVRVPPDQYGQNLLTIVRTFRRNGTSVLLMTSPTSFYKMGVPEELVALRLTPSKEAALHMHRQYNEIVRDIAAEERTLFVDIETEFEQSTTTERLFKADGIHYSRAGLHAISDRLCSALHKVLVRKEMSRKYDSVPGSP
ncbi:MAG: SGNH/GDSL hydrolase family protein [Candidatus Zixiibacteriota bacterium]